MTIEQVEGNLLEHKGIIVHGCNCMGVMGSGVAEGIRKTYPAAYKAYVRRHEIFGLQLGDIVAVANPKIRERYPELMKHIAVFDSTIPEDVIVVNAMTQYDYGRNPDIRYADYLAIRAAFVRVRSLSLAANAMPVSFPLIGCGLANGKWTEVGPIVDDALSVADGKPDAAATPARLVMLPGTKTN
jgi:O-acetyl-ADP-ribose deacetylase (regulator of RNase III)